MEIGLKGDSVRRADTSVMEEDDKSIMDAFKWNPETFSANMSLASSSANPMTF